MSKHGNRKDKGDTVHPKQEDKHPSDESDTQGLSLIALESVSSGSDVETTTIPTVQLNRILESVKALQGKVDAIAKQAGGGMAPNMDALRRIISGKERDKFLNSTRPATEIFSWNPYRTFVLHSGAQQHHPVNGTKKPVPPLIVGFVQWGGPGTEFPNPIYSNPKAPRRTGPKINMGRTLLHLHEYVTVTAEDIETFNLAPDTPVKAGVQPP